eukprot:1160878-Pelagomonas_calceolata.AAC.3
MAVRWSRSSGPAAAAAAAVLRPRYPHPAQGCSSHYPWLPPFPFDPINSQGELFFDISRPLLCELLVPCNKCVPSKE